MDIPTRQYKFLEDFSLRMEKLSLMSVLCYRSYNKEKFKSFGFNDYQEVTNLAIAVLLFAVEKTLTEDYCFFKDIKDFIVDIIDNYFCQKDSSRTDEDYLTLTQMIVSILADTEEYKHFNFKDKEYDDNPIYTKLLLDKLDTDISETDPIYYVPNNVLDFVFSTLEYNIYYAISLLQVKFEEGIRKKDYKKSFEELKKILQIERQKIREVKELIFRAKDNILEFHASTNFSETMNKNISLIKDHLEKYKSMKVQVERTEDEIRAVMDEKEQRDESLVIKSLEELSIVEDMKQTLDTLITKQSELLSTHIQLKNASYSSLMKLLASKVDKGIDLQKNFINKSLEDTKVLDEALIMLNCLFLPSNHIEKMFNINKCLEEQYPAKERTKNKKEDIDALQYDKKIVAERVEQNLLAKAGYEEVLSTFISIIFNSENRCITLKEIASLEESFKEYDILFNDIRRFSYVLYAILRDDGITSESLKRKVEDKTEEYRYEFNLSKALRAIYQNELPFKKFSVKKLADEKLIRFKEKRPKDGMQMYFESADYLLTIE